jgi:hypothetical protein
MAQMPPNARRRGFHPHEHKEILRLGFHPLSDSADQVSFAGAGIPKHRKGSGVSISRDIIDELLTSGKSVRVNIREVNLADRKGLPD